MLTVYNKGGDLLDTLSAENTVESFLVKQQSARPGRVAIMAIGIQDNKGQLHIIRNQADMTGLESMESMVSTEDGEVKGEWLMASKCRRGYELWRCV